MAGIFNGIKDTFTGGGGAPNFEGLSKRDRQQLINRQMAFGQTSASAMQDWLGQIRGAYGAQQSLLPLVYQELGITPQYDESGQVIGYQNTSNSQASQAAQDQTAYNNDMQSAQWQELATARMLGMNPVLGENGRVDWNLTTAQNPDIMGLDQLRAYQQTFNDRENQLYGQGQDAHKAALAQLNAPEYQAEGMDAQRRNLQTLQMLQYPELQRLGMMVTSEGQWANDPNSPEAKARALSGQYLDQSQAALRGEAQVDPTLTRQLQEEEQALKNSLMANLGPGYATTTAGQQALADFSKRRAEAIYSSNQDLASRGSQQYQGLNNAGLSTLQALYGIGQPVGQAAGQLNAASNAQEQLRQTSRNSRFSNLATTAQMLQGILGGQAQGNLGYQGARNSTAFNTLAMLRGAGQGYDNALANQSTRLNNAGMALNNRGTRLNQLYGGVLGAYRDTGMQSLAALTGQLGLQSPALPWATTQWQGDVTSDATNPNNMFWRNFFSNAGSTMGKAAGGGVVGFL